MKSSRKAKALAFSAAFTLTLLIVVPLSTRPVMAQATTGTIKGRVTDPNGAVVAGVIVTAKNEETGVTTAPTKTTGEGLFTIPNLIPGKYTLTVEGAGFKRENITGTDVRLGLDTTLDIALQTGGVTENVTITAGTETVIQTDQSQISATFEKRKVEELPSNAAGGGIDTLALLAPGVVPGFGNVNSNGTTLSVNGNRSRANNFTIDGTDNNDLTIGGPNYFVDNQDQVQEFQIITNNYSAQYGRNQGAIVNIITKSGTNDFHGSAFEFHRNSSALDAETNLERRDPTRGTRDKFISNVYGGTLGGPLYLPRFGEGGKATVGGKNKTFFFLSLQEIKQRQSAVVQSGTLAILPSEFPRLTAAFPGNPLIQAIANQSAFALTSGGIRIKPRADRPTDTVVIGGIPFAAAFPQFTFAEPFNEPEFSIRVDANATSKDNFYARYLYQKADEKNFLFSNGFLGDIPFSSKNLSGGYTHTLSARATNEFRATYQKLELLFGGGCSNVLSGCIPDPKDIDKSFTNISLPGVRGSGTGVSLRTIGPATNLPQGRIVKVLQFNDNLTFTKGRHSMTAGVDLRHLINSVPFLPNINGQFRITSVARLVANAPTSVTLGAGQSTISYKENDQYYYFQDDWKIRDNLTLNLGIRYEYSGQPINVLHNLTVARESNPNTALFRQDLPLEARTVPKIPPDKNNFAPRFGFAYTPRFKSGLMHRLLGENDTVLRGGYSIAYDPGFYNILLNVSTSAPSVFLNTITNTGGTTSPLFRVPANPTGDVVRASLGGFLQRNTFDPRFFNQTIVAPNFHSPYSQQYSFGIQRQINRNNVAEVRYVGNHGVGLFQSINRNPRFDNLINGFSTSVSGTDANGNTINAATFNFPGFPQFAKGAVPLKCTQAPGVKDNTAVCNGRLLPQGLLRSRENTAQSTYNSLQSRVNGRLLNQLTYGASYTFSKAIDNASEIFSFGEGAFAANPFDLSRAERGLSAFDRRHAFSMNFLYDIPYFKGQRGVLGKLLGGFQINSTYVIASGRRFTPSQFGNFGFGLPSYQDNTFQAGFVGLDALRPFNGNPNAGPTTVGLTDIDAALLGFTNGFIPSPTGFYSFNAFNTSGNMVTVTPNDVRYIFNGPGAALRFGNPFGNIGRNSAKGPKLNQANLGIFKNTKITEKVTLQFRAEFFNVFNHPNPGYGVAAGDDLPDNLIEDAGQTFNDRGEMNLSSRRVQFGLRLIF